MDPNSSQNMNNSLVDKKKMADEFTIKKEQIDAISYLKKMKVRHFKLESVEIETTSGSFLKTKMWVTHEDFAKPHSLEKESYECHICSKKFDKNQKLVLHLNSHNEE